MNAADPTTAPPGAPPASQGSRLSGRSSFIRFAITTALSFGINVGLTAALTELAGLPEEAAFAISLTVALTMNFLMMRYWIYEGQSGSGRRQLVLYLLSSAGFRGMDYVLFLLIHTWLGVPYAIAIIGILGVQFFVKFFYYRAVVFRGRAAA